ncbi:hypothetical protein LOAG_16383 [Loa loa]|uniref:Uncharacterized protein n=1 Tax=Loa loa TaxID=7209 RepID=A0A1S0UP65_LOALO|nr:hypothetical protein LOAG_16383 [Loa loa]EJD76707.1 hypothetical protein LOAG_16383 [Loa loa]
MKDEKSCILESIGKQIDVDVIIHKEKQEIYGKSEARMSHWIIRRSQETFIYSSKLFGIRGL